MGGLRSAPAYNEGVARLIPLVAIVGPTAAGKSALAMALAPVFDGEIVGADSRHVYRGLDVGTGKPSSADRARTPHHLIDVVEPDAEFSVAHYQEAAPPPSPPSTGGAACRCSWAARDTTCGRS